MCMNFNSFTDYEIIIITSPVILYNSSCIKIILLEVHGNIFFNLYMYVCI